MKTPNNRHFAVLLVLFFVLCLIYAWATPIFETPDEDTHFAVIDYIANKHELPVQVVGAKTSWQQEGSQPPLYYMISAALVLPIDRSDIEEFRQHNPHVQWGVPGAFDNKNLMLHKGNPPLKNTALAVYILRFVSTLMGLVTICSVYASARLIAPDNPWFPLIVAGFTAFNPMFIFLSAAVSNDNLVIMLNSLITWQLLLMLRNGLSTKRSLLLSILLALASISKLSGLVMMPTAALAACWIALRQRDWRGLTLLGVFVIIVWALLAGWWYFRNLTLYHELFGTNTMVAIAGARPVPFSIPIMLSEFEGFRISYWGLFGEFNILTVNLYYIVMDIVTIIALVGLVVYLWRNHANREQFFRLTLLALMPIIGAISVISWTAQTYASQGRLLFPFIAATSSLLVLGLMTVRFPARWLVSTLGVFAFIVPFVFIAPTYAAPTPLSALPDNVRKVYARFENTELVGYTTPDRRYKPGDSIPITLYWHVLDRSTRNLSLYLHAVTSADAQNVELGKVDSYPGGGRLQTTTWQPGAIYRDEYVIPISAQTVSVPAALSVQVGWWDYPSGTLIPAVDDKGQQLSSVMLEAGAIASITTEQPDKDATPVTNATFGGVIGLQSYTFDGSSQLLLNWNSLGTPDKNYTVFVQVLDKDNKIVGQGDAPPIFPTKYWLAGEHYSTHHTINYQTPLGNESYRIVIGWYEPTDFKRLDTAAGDGSYTLLTIDRGK